jgi:DNA (cytosine-5)-methyltransferase 1
VNYYNENDPKTAAWLRELIAANAIPAGDVDTRSICEVRPSDLGGYTSCHFFAGIGGWAFALRLAGWPDDKPVDTGSCPCQPFSVAGEGKGEADERHLWPIWFNLIRQRRPPVIFGEQVASPLALQWIDGVFANLEAESYACGASDLCAAGINAPHIRQRLYWVADAESNRLTRQQTARNWWAGVKHGSGLGEPDSTGWQSGRQTAEGYGYRDTIKPNGDAGRVEHSALSQSPRLGQQRQQLLGPAAWSAFDLIPCEDGKTRRIESGTFPLAYGVSGRVGLLRGYGNAIVPQLAAEFIQAYQEAINQIEGVR